MLAAWVLSLVFIWDCVCVFCKKPSAGTSFIFLSLTWCFLVDWCLLPIFIHVSFLFACLVTGCRSQQAPREGWGVVSCPTDLLWSRIWFCWKPESDICLQCSHYTFSVILPLLAFPFAISIFVGCSFLSFPNGQLGVGVVCLVLYWCMVFMMSVVCCLCTVHWHALLLTSGQDASAGDHHHGQD